MASVPVAPLGTDFQVNTAPPAKETPAVALDGSGNFVVVWKSVSQDTSGGGIYGQRYDAGGARQGVEFRVNTRTADNQEFASVARDDGGNFVVVWRSNAQDGALGGIYGQRYDAAGTAQGAEFRVNSTTAGDQTMPDVAMDPASGNFVVAWKGPDGVYVQRFDAAGVLVGSEVRANFADDPNLRFPRIATGPGGSFVVTWHKATSVANPISPGTVTFQRFDATGVKIGGEILVDTLSGRTPYASDVGVDAAGNVVVAWDARSTAPNPTTQPYDVFVRRFSAAGGPLGGPATVATALPAGYSQPVQLSVRPSGEFVVTYEAGLGPGNPRRVLTRGYDAAGNPTGGGLLVNRNTANQYSPAIDVGDDGRFVVAWLGDTNRVMALRYAPVLNAAGVGDFVWNDLNQNSLFNLDEAGVDGVIVSLFTQAGNQAGSAVTAAGGRYRFDNLRGGEPYFLHFQADAGTPFVTADVGPDDSVDSDVTSNSTTFAVTPQFTLAAGQADLTRDAGLVLPVAFEGVVWKDADGDGIREAGEAGVVNAFIEAHDADGTRRGAALSDGAGAFRLASLPPGTYQLSFLSPAGSNLALTTRDQGADDTADSDPDAASARTDFFILRPGDTVRGVGAGYATPTTISGFAYVDSDGNNTRGESEPTLPNCAVFADNNFNGVLDAGEAWTTTLSDGAYTLQVSPGSHRIASAMPAGWKLSTPVAARTVTVAQGARLTLIDLAHSPTGPVLHPTPLGPEFQIDSPALHNRMTPAAATDAHGNSVVVWRNTVDEVGHGHIFGRRYDATGTPRGVQFQVSVDPLYDSNPDVAVDNDGSFVVVWETGNGIAARRYDAAGNPAGGPFAVSRLSSSGNLAPHVAIGPTGGFAVGWGGPTATEERAALTRLFTAAGAARGDEFRVNDAPTADLTELISDVAFDSRGRLTGLYSPVHFGSPSVLARRFAADGSPLGPSTRVSAPGAGLRKSGSIAVAPDDTALVVWQDNGDVFGRLLDADGMPRAAAFRVNPVSSGTRSDPAVAAGGDGSFLVTWTDLNPGPNADGSEVRGQLVNPLGVPVGRSFRLNTRAAGQQFYSDVAPGPDGTFLAVWASEGVAGDFDGIFGQRIQTFSGAVSLGGHVWNDDGDGVREPGEPGHDGVLVEVYNDAGALFDTAGTGVDGTYLVRGLRPGDTYRARFVAADGTVFSPRDQGTDELRDSDIDPATGLSNPLSLVTDGFQLDAGLMAAATLSGAVFNDASGDGARSADEPGLGGWTVYLDANENGELDPGEISTLSAVDGTYSLGDLRPGRHQVAAVPLLRWSLTTPATSLAPSLAVGQALAGVNIGARSSVPTNARADHAGLPIDAGEALASFFRPSAAADADGDIVVVYHDSGGPRGQRFTAAGVPQGPRFAVGQSNGGPAAVDADADGDFVVVYPRNSNVYGRRFNAAGQAQGGEFLVNDAGPAAAAPNADVALDADGDFVVTWAAPDESGSGVYGRRFSAAGVPRGGAFLVNTTTIDDQVRPSIGSDAAGNFAIAWVSEGVSASATIRMQRFDAAGTRAGGEIVVHRNNFIYFDAPDVAMNGAGEILVAFVGFDAQDQGILARRFDPAGVPQGGAFAVNASERNDQTDPHAAMADDGSFAVAWTEQTIFGDQNVLARYFNPLGSPAGPDMMVGVSPEGRQLQPATAMAGDGSQFVVAYAEYPGTTQRVLVQRFEVYRDPASVAGLAFTDADDDGVFDPGESGRPGIAVVLIDPDGRERVTTTDAAGHYQFDDLRPGATYHIRFAAPSGYGFSRTNGGPAGSDVDPATGLTAPFVPEAKQSLGRDAGLVELASLSGVVFNDEDSDGVRDSDEAGLSGWTVFLDADADGLLDEGERWSVTGAGGAYAFADVRPGAYHVVEVPQPRWDATTPLSARTVRLAPGQNAGSLNLGYHPSAPALHSRPVGAPIPGQPSTAWWNSHRWEYFDSDASGGFVLVGERFGGRRDEYSITAVRYDSQGNPLGEADFGPNTSTDSRVSPAVSVAPDGSFVVTWLQSRSDRPGTVDVGVYAARFDAAGRRLGPDLRVNTATPEWQTDPSVAASADGSFVVVFEGVDETSRHVYARRYDAAGEPQGPDFRVDVEAGNIGTPHVAADADGDFVVIWGTHNSDGRSDNDLRARWYRADGTPRGGEVYIGGSNGAVTMNAAGETVIAFLFSTVQGAVVRALRFDAAGNRLGGEVRVSDRIGGAVPYVGMDDDGGFVVAWQNDDGGVPAPGDRLSRGAFYRRFSGAGWPVGEEARYSQPIEGIRSDPMVAVLPGGNFLTAYHGQDAAGNQQAWVQRYETYAEQSIAGGFVWTDADGDGVYDAGEAPAAGVRVELSNPEGALAGTGVTAADGTYRFAGLKPGTPYILRFRIPADAAASAIDQGGNDAADSDFASTADPSLPGGSFTAPAAGRVRLDYGLGLTSPARVAGTTFNDRNANGVRDAGEEPLASWFVFTDSNNNGRLDPDERVRTTDTNGAFSFDRLSPGTYRVRVVAQDLWAVTTPASAVDVLVRGGQVLAGVNVGLHTDAPDTRHVRSGPQIKVNSGTYPGMGTAEIAADSAGNFVVVWTTFQSSTTPETIRAQRFNAQGLPLGAEFVVARTVGIPDIGVFARPAVAMDADGDFVVVWQRQDSTASGEVVRDVYARQFDATGNAAGPAFRVNTTTDGDQSAPDVAIADDGRFVVAWLQRQLPFNYSVHLQRFAADGVPDGGEVRANTVGTRADHPAVAMNGTGAVVLAWDGWGEMIESGARNVFAQRFDPSGQRSGSPILVNAGTAGEQTEPDVGMDADGDFVVAWRSLYSPARTEVRRFNRQGVPQGGDVEFQYGESHQVAMAPDGSFIVTWDLSNGHDADSFAVRFNAAGLQQGPVFPVSPITSGNEARPSIDTDAAGNFIVAWGNATPAGVQTMAAQRFQIDRAPTASVLPDLSVEPDAPDTVIDLGPVFADDRDGDPQLIFAVTQNTNPGLFTSATISGGNLTLDYAPGAVGSSVITVRATDRSGLFVEATFRVTVGGPRVTRVFVAGTGWSAAFRKALADSGRGESDHGYELADPSQLATLPWANVNELSLRFDAGVTLDAAALAVRGLNLFSYAVAGYRYDPDTRTATWTLVNPLRNDRARLEQGSFVRLLNVLRGDVNGDGRVNALDLTEVRRRLNSRTDANVGSGYSVFADVDGSGRINSLDLAAVGGNLNRTLPPLPLQPDAPATSAPLAAIREELFGNLPILPA